jgi:hypothetical protein
MATQAQPPAGMPSVKLFASASILFACARLGAPGYTPHPPANPGCLRV